MEKKNNNNSNKIISNNSSKISNQSNIKTIHKNLKENKNFTKVIKLPIKKKLQKT